MYHEQAPLASKFAFGIVTGSFPTDVLLYSDTHRAESTDMVAISPAKDTNRKSAPTTVSRHSDSAVRQTGFDQGSATSRGSQHVDVALKRRQIGSKRKSLQEMRHLLNAATITVGVPVSANSFSFSYKQ